MAGDLWGDGSWGDDTWGTIGADNSGSTTPIYSDTAKLPSDTEPRIYDWGTDTWGDSPLFGTPTDDRETYVHNNTRDVWETLDNAALTVERNDVVYKLIHTLQRDINRFDDAVRYQYTGFFVELAQGESLERIAERYQLNRRDGESDTQLRRRIKARIGAITSDGTFEEFASVVLFVLDADPDEVQLIPPSESGVTATVIVQTSAGVIDDTEFTENEIISLLEDAVAAGGRVQIRADGTFQFDGQNFTPDANTGFDEGTFGGSY